MLSVVIPAHNEADWIGRCLDALLAQTLPPADWEVIVVANGCTDRTAERVRSYAPRFAARAQRLDCLEVVEGSKPGALDAGDAAARGALRVYLDADVVLSSEVLSQLQAVLLPSAPVYASGRLVVAPARSPITRAYARVWSKLPFMAKGVPGAGLFAVNDQGRARWGTWPRPAEGASFVSDDTFVRLHFRPEERVAVAGTYLWPMAEGFAALMRTRRRQNDLLTDLYARFPHLREAPGDPPLSRREAIGLLVRHPFGSAIYLSVALLAKLTAGRDLSYRGRPQAAKPA